MWHLCFHFDCFAKEGVLNPSNIVKTAIGVVAVSALGLSIKMAQTPSQPFDSDGNVGNTSYKSTPFENQVFGQSWGASVGLTPTQLYYSSNPNSFYLNPSNIAAAQGASSSLNSSGVVQQVVLSVGKIPMQHPSLLPSQVNPFGSLMIE